MPGPKRFTIGGLMIAVAAVAVVLRYGPMLLDWYDGLGLGFSLTDHPILVGFIEFMAVCSLALIGGPIVSAKALSLARQYSRRHDRADDPGPKRG